MATIGHVADVLTTTVWEKAAALAAAPLLFAEALRFAEEAIDLREDVVRYVRRGVRLGHYWILCNLHSARPPDGAELQSSFSNRESASAFLSGTAVLLTTVRACVTVQRAGLCLIDLLPPVRLLPQQVIDLL